MSDLNERDRTYALEFLRTLVRNEIRKGTTREGIVAALQKRGVKPEIAAAFLNRFESAHPYIKQLLDDAEQKSVLKRLQAVVAANYHE